MRVLCLGNNTEDTDRITRNLADNTCHGLLSELDGPLPSIKDGWYHSSIYDISYGKLIEIAKDFDQVIMLDQSKEQYSHPNAFYQTVRLIKNIPNGKFINDSYSNSITFFENLVLENPSFCIHPFIQMLVQNGNTTVCCRSEKPITHLSKLKSYKTDPNYQEIRNSMLNGKKIPEHCGYCYALEDKGITSARQQETIEWANK